MPLIESTRLPTRWVTRTVPIFLVLAVSYATYAVVGRVCAQYLIGKRGEIGAAITILVLYFILLLLMIGTYLRTIITVFTDPGVVPYGPGVIERKKAARERRRRRRQEPDLESIPYDPCPDSNPDSPGLEEFYTKDVFVCENDGRPKWCSECSTWKPDRVHHSSEIDRCVYRMDHYCPWVGGMIGENSFKFFVQFITYATCYCGLVLGATASSLRKEISEGSSSSDPNFIPAVVLAAFFGLFTFLMAVTSMRYIFFNMTNVDILGYQSKVYQLAVRVPRGTDSTDNFNVVTYPLPRPGEDANGWSNGTARPGMDESGGSTLHIRPSVRDDLATRTFAILKTEPGENPWDLGKWRNWKSVMGNNVLDWFLPIRRSPCANHESHESFYPMGHVLADVLARYDLTDVAMKDGPELEMREIARGNRA
ncbi:palmitoyltransferase PFA5 [Daldinia sp. FL1419]|nr:palmitoyltransferase PFA5 [Daldinia sp. FL1419]